MPLAGQQSHIKEHARHIKKQKLEDHGFSKNLVLVSRLKQASYLKAVIRSSSFYVSLTAFLQ